MNWFKNLPLFMQIFFASAIGSSFVNFIFKLVEKFFEYRLDHSKENFKDKKNLADDVIAICVEGMSTSLTVHPRNIEEIYLVIEKVKLEDTRVSEQIGSFVSNWQICASRHYQKIGLSDDEVKFVTELQQDGRNQSRKILDVVNKWKK